MTIEKWRAGILSFYSEKQYENPFLDVVIKAVFTSPSGKKIIREAYWDGENIYRVSFAPTEIGEWDYIVHCNDDNGLNGVGGRIECVEYKGDLAIYKHGFLKIGGQGKYIAHSDDTPFFWLGDTHWGFVSGERWNESNHSEMKSMFKGMVDRRVAQKFNVYQTNLRSDSLWGNTRYWLDGEKGILPNIEFYQQEVDPKMQYIADAGLVNALGVAWGMSINGKIDFYKNFMRYIIARYGALPMVWTLAGEVAGYDGQRQELINGWREVALLIEQLDGYNNLQTAHYTNERPFADYYHDEAWYDFTLNQAGHGDLPVSAKHYKDYRAKYPDKPFIEGESFYEGVSTLEENGSRIADSSMMRRVAYISIQLGGCGYTYGAQGIWDTVWDKAEVSSSNIFNLGNKTWIDGIEAEGGYQMTYMREFYEKVEFTQLSPCPWCYKNGARFGDETLFGMFAPYVSANCDMSTVVLYYSSHSRNSGNKAKLQYLQNREYTAQWFDPRTGEYTLVADGIQPLDTEWTLPEKPSAEDWLLTIRVKAKENG